MNKQELLEKLLGDLIENQESTKMDITVGIKLVPGGHDPVLGGYIYMHYCAYISKALYNGKDMSIMGSPVYVANYPNMAMAGLINELSKDGFDGTIGFSLETMSKCNVDLMLELNKEGGG